MKRQQESGTKESDCILIVDDDETLCRALDILLTRNGYSVRTSYSADSAMELFRQYPFPAVLLDLRLGDENSLELIAEMKKIRPDVVIIVLTAYGTEQEEREALCKGANRFLYKPLSPQNLLRLIDDVLPGHD